MYVLAPNQTVETFPYSIGELRRDNPNTSFPRNPSDELLADWNVFPVVDRPTPDHNTATQTCTQINPTLENGEWIMTWQVSDASSDEIAARLEGESAAVRMDRNRRLADCDWTQLSDCPLSDADKTAWATYRSQLRAVPEQSEFPWNVTWPTKPS
jgi:hypothetical protein